MGRPEKVGGVDPLGAGAAGVSSRHWHEGARGKRLVRDESTRGTSSAVALRAVVTRLSDGADAALLPAGQHAQDAERQQAIVAELPAAAHDAFWADATLGSAKAAATTASVIMRRRRMAGRVNIGKSGKRGGAFPHSKANPF